MDHGIITALITSLTKWYDNHINNTGDEMDPFIDAQDQIGWDYLLDRWLSRQWHLHQEQVW